MMWTVEFVTFRLLGKSNEVSTNSLGSSFFFLVDYKFLLQTGIPKCTYVKLGFQPLNNSNGVFEAALVGTQFNINAIVLRASDHNILSHLELRNMLRTMSNRVMFLLSATPFWYGEPV